MICGQLKKKDPYGHMNKNKTVNKIAIGFMILIVILFLTVVISALIKSPKSYERGNVCNNAPSLIEIALSCSGCPKRPEP